MSDHLLNDAAPASEVPERFDPETMQGQLLEAEHLARYRWAAQLAEGRRVLDAGCGTAYGTVLLAGAGAAQVVGLDRAAEVLDAVRATMPANVALEQGDVTSLPYEDGSFDVVVCFEVIEHLGDPGSALSEFRRVLAADGVLAVSSPNRNVYPPGNPHHVHEYTPDELEAELASRFAFATAERQHTWIASGVLDDEQFHLGEDALMTVDVRKLIADEPGGELYTVALAGQRELPRLRPIFELTTSVELRKWDELWHEQAVVLEQQRELLTAHEQVFSDHAITDGQLRNEMHQLRNQLAKTESELARMPELDAQLRELLDVNDQLLAMNHELQRRQVHLEQLEEIATRYTVLVESSSWKLTRFLRQAAALARKFAK
ncbi:MAG TPA: class I SAM-dependent methyltransferase [Solirubrobacteraceae bacterium]|jgi:SAM-dependent methyltransferase|nr:class I SAM-dependent methyltransferase [Solirubrobacteraceae bacterium]